MMDTTKEGRLGDRTLLPGTEGLKHSDPSGSSADYEASTYTLNQQQQPLQQQSVAKARRRPEHPQPKNKDARKHMARLRNLGYSNINEVDIDYWEPAKAGEDKGRLMARRQRECQVMNSLLDKLEAKALVRDAIKPLKPRNSVIEINDADEISLIETQEEELSSLQKMNQSLVERKNQLEARLEKESQLRITAENRVIEEEEIRKQAEAQYLSLLEQQQHLSPEERSGMLLEKFEEQSTKLEEQATRLKDVTNKVEEQASKIKELTSKYNNLLQKFRKASDENSVLKEHKALAEKENNSLKEALKSRETESTSKLRRKLEMSEAENAELRNRLQGVQELQQQTALNGVDGLIANTEVRNDLVQILEELLDRKLEEKLHKIAKVQPQLRNLQWRNTNSDAESLGTPATELDGFSFPRMRKRNKRANSVDTVDSAAKNRRTVTYSQVARSDRNQHRKSRIPAEKQPSVNSTRSSKLRKVLILPEADKKVVDNMREKKLKARELGVKNVVEFPSGAALLLIQEEKAQEAIRKLGEAGLQQKVQAQRDDNTTRFKVHDIPEGNTEVDVADEIHGILGIRPENITLVSYKDEKKKKFRLGIVEGNKDLIDAVKDRRYMFIDYRHCRIDMKPNLMRCKTCKLLGHTKNYCEGIPAAVLLDFQQQEKACLDCLAYNKRMAIAGFPNSRYRFTDHELHSRECPTKKAFLRKMNRPVRGATAEQPDG